MKIKLKVIQTATDTRSIVDSKTGATRNLKITNVLASLEDGEMIACRTFKDDYKAPKVGDVIEVEPRRYEKKSMVADLLF